MSRGTDVMEKSFGGKRHSCDGRGTRVMEEALVVMKQALV